MFTTLRMYTVAAKQKRFIGLFKIFAQVTLITAKNKSETRKHQQFFITSSLIFEKIKPFAICVAHVFKRVINCVEIINYLKLSEKFFSTFINRFRATKIKTYENLRNSIVYEKNSNNIIVS